MTVTAGKTVKIKVHSVSKTDVLIDYLFETASLGTGKYFVYDPTITESKVVTPTTSPAPASDGTDLTMGNTGSTTPSTKSLMNTAPGTAPAPESSEDADGFLSAGTLTQASAVATLLVVGAATWVTSNN